MFSLNLNGRLVEFVRPAIMAVINVTPDSLFVGELDSAALEQHISKAVDDGADILDIGAASSRPGSTPPSPEEEMRRLQLAVPLARKIAPQIPISVDTWRASVADFAVRTLGADIVNDISAASLDPLMEQTIVDLNVPYVVMHMRGNPETMQSLTGYGNEPDAVVADVILNISRVVERLRLKGLNDIIVDPGFGFAKSIDENYALLASIPLLKKAFDGLPLLVGLSRKSMFTKLLNIPVDDALPPTIAANSLALYFGTDILRVHDVKEAALTRDVVAKTLDFKINTTI